MGKAVSVVKRPDYIPTTPKFADTNMECANVAYPRKQWSSLMVISPSHCGWRRIKWDMKDRAYFAEMGWLKDSEIGDLPDEWNRCVDEGDELSGARLVHWTLGIPAFNTHTPGAALWVAEKAHATALPLPTKLSGF
jgi:hypothetical protein